MNVACACDEIRPSIAKTCSHAVSAHAVDFEHVETKLETSGGGGGSLATVNPPPPPPCVRACLLTSDKDGNMESFDVSPSQGLLQTEEAP